MSAVAGSSTQAGRKPPFETTPVLSKHKRRASDDKAVHEDIVNGKVRKKKATDHAKPLAEPEYLEEPDRGKPDSRKARLERRNARSSARAKENPGTSAYAMKAARVRKARSSAPKNAERINAAAQSARPVPEAALEVAPHAPEAAPEVAPPPPEAATEVDPPPPEATPQSAISVDTAGPSYQPFSFSFSAPAQSVPAPAQTPQAAGQLAQLQPDAVSDVPTPAAGQFATVQPAHNVGQSGQTALTQSLPAAVQPVPNLVQIPTAAAQPTVVSQPLAGLMPVFVPQGGHIPPGVLQLLKELYQTDHGVVLSDRDASELWTLLDEHQRRHVLDLYSKRVAQAHTAARDAAFKRVPTLIIQADPSQRQSSASRRTDPVTSQDSTQSTTPRAFAANAGPLSANTPAATEIAPQPSLSNSSVGSSSYESMEGVRHHSPSLGTSLDPYSQSHSSFSSAETMDSTPDEGRLPASVKGKGRAESTTDYEDINDSPNYAMFEQDGYITDDDDDHDDDTMSLTPRARSPEIAAPPMPSTTPQAGSSEAVAPANPGPSSFVPSPSSPGSTSPAPANLTPDMFAFMMHKVDSVAKVVRDQAVFMQEQAVKNNQFQQALLEELRGLREDGRNPTGRGSKDDGPAPRKLRTRGAVLEVQKRVARIRGQELVLTPEQIEEQHRICLLGRVHAHMLALLKVHDTSELFNRHPSLTAEQAKAYLAGESDITCTPENLRVDFVRKWKDFKLNVEARRIMLLTFRKKAAGGAFAKSPVPEHMLTDEYLGQIVDQYMKNMRRAYKKAAKPASKAASDLQKKLAAETARKGSLLKSRIFVVVHLGYTSHKRLIMLMEAHNMSGDETDGEVRHPAVYRIIIADWQSEELRLLLWALDAQYHAYWAHPPHRRRLSGNPPRHREIMDGTRTVGGVAPVGLWRNCYNDAWLDKQSEWEIERLQIVEEDYDFRLVEGGVHAGPSGPAFGQQPPAQAGPAART